MFRNEIQISDGKRYVVLECQFRREWQVAMEARGTVTSGEAIEICQYWIKYSETGLSSKTKIRLIFSTLFFNLTNRFKRY